MALADAQYRYSGCPQCGELSVQGPETDAQIVAECALPCLFLLGPAAEGDAGRGVREGNGERERDAAEVHARALAPAATRVARAPVRVAAPMASLRIPLLALRAAVGPPPGAPTEDVSLPLLQAVEQGAPLPEEAIP